MKILGIRSLHLFPILVSLIPAQSPAQITLNPLPTRVIGQTSVQVTNRNPNLVEGREFQTPEGIALDTSTNPPGLFVSDTGNNRVLGFRSATGFANGQKADIVIGQLDFVTTFPQGPGSGGRTTGLSSPSGIAVDASGNLYVVDGGNNRILRFPKPFVQSGDQLPDLVLGQASFATNGANQGGISASSLAFTTGGSVLQAFIAFDSAGNLWVADAGNNRVLRFNASALGSQATSGPVADLVLGQSDFTSNGYVAGASPGTSVTAFTSPTGIAFDTAGRLFVSESINNRRSRILVWTPPFFTGQSASRLLGVDTNVPQPPAVSEFQLNASAGGIFAIGDGIGVADTFDHRILVFPPVDQWTAGATFQAAVGVAGQADFKGGTSNRGQPTAGPDRLSGPGAAVSSGSELYIADSLNNRVIVMPQTGNAFGPATRVLGQDNFTLNAPNLVEGREFDFTSLATGSADAGIAVDLTSTPPHLYVADTYNNRILGYNDLRNIQPGAKADLVIGQPDFQQTLANYPGNNVNISNSAGLYFPVGVVVDSSGNLYVADTGNGRVLRFPKPFANFTPGTPEQADLVLGQSSFTAAKIGDPTQRTMSQPYGVAFTYAGGLLVSDLALNRVLYFAGHSADFTSGMSASIVFGQPDFNSAASGSGGNQLHSPHHISVDTDDRLYVADSGNGRVAIFDHAPTAVPGQPAAQLLTANLNSPRGVYVSGDTGDIWIGDAGTGQAIRFPAYNQLQATGGTPNATINDAGRPIALVVDQWGNLFLADAAQRIVIYYPGLGAINSANFLRPNQLAPGMITSIFTQGNFNQFGGQPAQAGTLPLPRQLNGIQVLFNGSPVPLFYADANQINFQVPNSAPQSGTADLQVLEAGTGRVLGDTTVAMAPVSPGLFTVAGNGSGAAAALNEDGTRNSQTNPAVQGSVITLFGTGQGFIAGAPPDGNISNAQLQSARAPTVIISPDVITGPDVIYAGLAPTLVGVWQVNVRIPKDVITTPTNPTQVVVVQDSVASGGGGLGRPVLIYVKQRP